MYKRQQLLKQMQAIHLQGPIVKRLGRPLYYAWQDWKYSALARRNRELRDTHSNERCFIMLTGPSINEMDFSLLKNEYVFGINLLYRHKNFQKLNISFYDLGGAWRCLRTKRMVFEALFATDGIYITPENYENVLVDRYSVVDEYCKRNRDAIRRVPIEYYRGIDAACASPNTIFFTTADSKRCLDKYGLFQGRRVHYIKNCALPMAVSKIQWNDLAGKISFLDGCVFLSIAGAIYMGFKELYLCGAGYTYRPIMELHFYDEPVVSKDVPGDITKIASEIADAFGAPGVHKIREYGDSYRITLTRNVKIDRRHQIMKDFADAHGVRIYNIVPDGFESPIYERVSWDSVVREVIQRASGHGLYSAPAGSVQE